jgi:hypothetical protein
MLRIEFADGAVQDRSNRRSTGQAIPGVIDAFEHVHAGRLITARGRSAESPVSESLAAVLAAAERGKLIVGISKKRTIAAGIDPDERSNAVWRGAATETARIH